MLSEVRLAKLIELLNEKGSVKVSELCEMFRVTEKTIRKDLENLEQRGILKRVHGGAVLIENATSMLPIFKRRVRQQQEKTEIAAEASSLIEDGHIILLDAGSTTLEVAKLIQNRSLTAVTNDTQISSILAECGNIDLFVLGGYRRKGTYTIVGQSAINMLNELNIDIAFLGCTGIDLDRGLSIFHREEAELKKRMIRAAKRTVLLADHTKFERTALITFAKLEDIDVLVTDSRTSESVLEKIIGKGVQVIRARPSEESAP
jgi:DeoR/GlpR family transcriptional regulator of sugar metabolism